MVEVDLDAYGESIREKDFVADMNYFYSTKTRKDQHVSFNREKNA